MGSEMCIRDRSKVHENMDRAHSRGAASQQKFWWRSHMVVPGEPCAGDREDSVVEMTLLEILTGKGGYYPGLVPLCVEIKILRRVCAESSRRPPRHRRDACSMAWRCRFLTARPSQDGRVIAEK